jgi:CRISPR-associated endonuclease/helicase Cas3
VAELLIDLLLGPCAREQLLAAFRPLGAARDWVAVLCGLHDLGKCSPAFQSLRTALAAELLPHAEFPDVERAAMWRQPLIRADTPHGVLTAVHLERSLTGWGASRETARTLARVLGGHHGVILEAAAIRQAGHAAGDHGGRNWQLQCDSIAGRVIRLWGLPDPAGLAWHQIRMPPSAAVSLAGLATVSDWIASSLPPADYAGADVDLGAYLESARYFAAEKMTALGWAPWEGPADTTFGNLFPDEPGPLPVQQVVQDAVLDVQEAGILVVSAPTGEGKTKAALQAAVTLLRRLHLCGFYVAMPDRASSNQAFDVARQLLAPFGQASRLRLVHSSAAEYLNNQMLAAGDAETRFYEVDADGSGLEPGSKGEPGAMTAEDWFTRRRGVLAPFGAGTVDQVLRMAIRHRHVFAGLAGLSGKVIIFDEVHGYDVHMSVLFDRLLWWLGAFRVPVVLLSATLSTRQQHRLVSNWRAGALGQAPGESPSESPGPAAYPRVVWADPNSDAPAEKATEVSRLNRCRRVQLTHVAFDDHVGWALTRAGEGCCVAIVHNVVRHAIAAWTQLTSAVASLPAAERPVTVLLHGRLTAAERAAAEAGVRRMFGPAGDQGTGTRPERAVVVSTQVLEQSLDLDFDVMITAMAPVDSLIQRMGRIQRHQRLSARPPLEMAVTGVELAKGNVAFPAYTTRVYDEAVLLRTWAMLRDRTGITSPDDVQGLIDAVYDLGSPLRCPAGWERQWAKAHATMRGKAEQQEFDARTIYLPPVTSAGRLHEITARGASPRRTRRDRPWEHHDAG